MESAYYILTHYRLAPAKQARQIKALENALEQLEQYHSKAPKHKLTIIECLIAKYDELLSNLI